MKIEAIKISVFETASNTGRFDLVDRKRIAEEETWGHVAVSGNDVFVRELKAISAFRWN